MATKYHSIQLSELAPAQSGSYYGGSTDGDEIIVWYDRSKRCWCGTFSGVSNGLAYESEDNEGFKSKKEAIDFMLDAYRTMNEEVAYE